MFKITNTRPFYRLMEQYQQVSADGELFLKLQPHKKYKATSDINQAHADAFKLSSPDNISYGKSGTLMVMEDETNSDVLSEDQHLVGCRKHLEDGQVRNWNARCSCREIEATAKGSNFDKSEWRSEVSKLIKQLQQLDADEELNKKA